MNKDCIKIDDMHFTEMHTNPLHGTVKARLKSANGHVTKMSVVLPQTELVSETLAYMKNHEFEVYIVRKSSNMANLGMAIIKSSFEQGYTGGDKYESMADEVREMIGTRILTRVPTEEFIHRTESDFIEMRVEGVVVCSCKDLFAYTRPDNVVLFEAQNLGEPCENGMIHAQNDLNTDYFKRRQFGLRSYNAQYVRPATEVQHIEYLKLKYEFLKSLANETDNNK